MNNLFSYVYLNFDPVNDWHLRESSQRYSDEILDVIHAHIEKLSGSKVRSLQQTVCSALTDTLDVLALDFGRLESP